MSARGWVREGDVPPQSRSAEAFEEVLVADPGGGGGGGGGGRGVYPPPPQSMVH